MFVIGNNTSPLQSIDPRFETLADSERDMDHFDKMTDIMHKIDGFTHAVVEEF